MDFYDCLTEFIFLKDRPEKSDVIFIPGGDYPDSAIRAAELFSDGYAPLLLPSGRFSKLKGRFSMDPEYRTEWEYLSAVLRREGVPPDAILKEDRATFTWENAIYSRKVLEAGGIRIRKAIIVCQAFHARRCKMYYQEQFPSACLLMCPVETRGITRENWMKDDRGIDTVLGEVERCGSQFHAILKEKMTHPAPAEESFPGDRWK